MTSWKTYRLGDVISIKSGFAYKGEYLGKGDKYLLGMGCVSFNEKFLPSGARLYAGDVPSRYFVKAGDIVLATRQQSDNMPILGMPAIIPSTYKNTFVGANLYAVQNDSDIDNNYLYWLLRTPEYIQHIKSCQTGTTVRMITKSNIESFEFKCPNHIERNRISNLLWSLENKIENNRRINANLELQAQALFDGLICDENLEYEYIANLEHIIDTGRRPKGGVANIVNGVPSIGAENIKGLGKYDYSKTKYITEEFAQSLKKGFIKGYELLIYKDGGKPGYFIPNFSIFGEGFPYDKMALNEHVFLLDFGNQGYNFFAYFFFQTEEVMRYLNAQGSKAAIPGINRNDVESIAIPTIENETVKEFCKRVEPIITAILTNAKESSRLATLRDTLLPKLMNGEIKL